MKKATWKITFEDEGDLGYPFDSPQKVSVRGIPGDWDSGDVIDYIENRSRIAGCLVLEAKQVHKAQAARRTPGGMEEI